MAGVRIRVRDGVIISNRVRGRVKLVNYSLIGALPIGMLIFGNLNSRYENFNSRDSTSSRIPDALTDHVLKASQVRS